MFSPNETGVRGVRLLGGRQCQRSATQFTESHRPEAIAKRVEDPRPTCSMVSPGPLGAAIHWRPDTAASRAHRGLVLSCGTEGRVGVPGQRCEVNAGRRVVESNTSQPRC